VPTRLSVFGIRIPENAIQGRYVLPVASLLTAALTLVEWYFRLDFSLGVLYTIPVLIVASALNRWQVVVFGLVAALARAPFTPAASPLEIFLKFLMASMAYTGIGLLIVEMSNNRRRVIENYARLQLEQELRRRAEEQLRTLADSSPAAIVTLNVHAQVLAANRAAHEMLGVPPGLLIGRAVEANLPMFANALKVASANDRQIRTSVTGWARRLDDHIFPIQAWFSVYGHGEGRCLAAIVVDMSEEVRDRERENFQHLLDYNRLLAGAVSHEIRNLCSAISVVCSNLSDRTDLKNNADFDALVRLVDGLMQLASFELRNTTSLDRRADLKAVLDQLRVVIEPDWEEIEGEVIWNVSEDLPAVAADAHALLQIFLNLCQNSLRAVEPMNERRLTVSVVRNGSDAIVTFRDSGPGVADPSRLFHLHPVRPEHGGSGLGLYISRELARSVGGELEYVASGQGAEFQVVIPVMSAQLLVPEVRRVAS
jgi:PAS domain S-box-containing protein